MEVSGAVRPVQAPPSRKRFEVGDMLPIKGVWFKIVELKEPRTLILEAQSETAKARKGRR